MSYPRTVLISEWRRECFLGTTMLICLTNYFKWREYRLREYRFLLSNHYV